MTESFTHTYRSDRPRTLERRRELERHYRDTVYADATGVRCEREEDCRASVEGKLFSPWRPSSPTARPEASCTARRTTNPRRRVAAGSVRG